MASFYMSEKGPYVTIKVDGKRRKFQLTKYDERAARAIYSHIESLEVAKLTATGIPFPAVQWLENIEPSLRERLANIGLCAAGEIVTVSELVERFLSNRRMKVAAVTFSMWKVTGNLLTSLFPNDPDIRTLDEDITLQLREAVTDRFADSTASKRLQDFKAIFSFAVAKGYLSQNPMDWFTGATASAAEKEGFTTPRLDSSCSDARVTRRSLTVYRGRNDTAVACGLLCSKR